VFVDETHSAEAAVEMAAEVGAAAVVVLREAEATCRVRLLDGDRMQERKVRQEWSR
jgi:hypothetical protein